MLFETRCAGCDTPGADICTTCRFALAGRPPRPQAHGVLAAVPFTGRARQVLLSVKYRNRRQAARHVAGLLVNRLVEAGAASGVDVVTWAPTSRRRRRERGFDQGEVIARTVARQLGLPVRRLLERPGDRPAQTGLTRADRIGGPAFRARRGLRGVAVLVVDDVVTTGATLRAARTALTGAGAGAVVLAAVAATPAVGAHRRQTATILPLRRVGADTAA